MTGQSSLGVDGRRFDLASVCRVLASRWNVCSCYLL